MALGIRERRKCRPRKRLRAGRNRAKIFFGNLERGQKDGHFGAHEGGDKRGLTGRDGSGEEKRLNTEGAEDADGKRKDRVVESRRGASSLRGGSDPSIAAGMFGHLA